MDLYDVIRSFGKKYATMYFLISMNLAEIRREWGISKASMNTSIRKFQYNGLVKNIPARIPKTYVYR